MTDNDRLREAILATLEVKGNRVLSTRELTSRLQNRLDSDLEEETVERVLDELEAEGRLVEIRGGRFSLPRHTPYLTGRFRSRSDGSGTILVSREGRDETYFVARNQQHDAMHGDMVMARPEKRGRQKRTASGYLPPARIVRILSRAHDTVVGRFHSAEVSWVRPFDTRIDNDIEIPEDGTLGAENGQMVEAEITRYPDRSGLAAGRVIDVIGYIWEKGVDVEIVLRKYRIPRVFDPEVLEEADRIELKVTEEEITGRVDLRDRTIVTIDGETARDFDDAVEVRPGENGHYILGVHIADVSHYVTTGSKLDEEAWQRGTSVYFPGRVVPMLPERLSNGICSLNPDEDRLTFSAEMEFDDQGRMISRRFFRSVIRSKARLTYSEVNGIISGNPALEATYSHLLGDIRRLEALYRILRRQRAARGSIDFDLPQHEVLLTQEGNIETIKALERNDAHRLIEEFMLAANEAVAQELFFSDQPALYRNHPRPKLEKLEELKELIEEVGYSLKGDLEEIEPRALRKVLDKIEGAPEERFINEVVLRSMSRASYEPECEGHFALAIEQYTHFTSPIRRYPDLVVHRVLADLLAEGALHGDQREVMERDLATTAEQSSMTERRAEQAEREVLEWKKVIFMLDKVGEEFAGFITGIAPFGLFVELDEFFVQGMVPVATIGGDFWVFAEAEHRLRGRETSRELKLGDPVVVRIEEIDEDRQQIELRLVSASGKPIAASERVRGRQRRR